MGNCLVAGENKKDVIKIMRIDGKILQYQSPTTVHQVLSEFPGHSIADDALPVVRHLDRRLYDLMQPMKAPQAKGVVVRVKVVISKQELKKILEREGLALGDVMSQVQMNKKIPGNCEEEDGRAGWKPELESIQE